MIGWSYFKGNILWIILFVIVLAAFMAGVKNLSVSQNEEALRSAYNSINKAAVSCYAIEGAYPESYAYIKENYGVNINENKYIVSYNIFASNIMPEIDVIEKQDDGWINE